MHRTESTPPWISMMSWAMLVASRSDSILGADRWQNCIGNPCLQDGEVRGMRVNKGRGSRRPADENNETTSSDRLTLKE